LSSVVRDRGAALIPNAHGEVLAPSVVGLEDDGTIIGQAARERLLTHPTQTIASFQRIQTKWRVCMDRYRHHR
jgi:molecular chaperone HscC